MLKLVCTSCRYIYNPYIWDEEQEIEPWVDFSMIPDYWQCPSCWADKDEFIELIMPINEISDIENMIPQEESHCPFYRIDWDNIFVRIGTEDEPYVQDDVHFVEFVWLYDENGEELDICILPDTDEEIRFSNPWEPFEIRSSCSLHWIWKWIYINNT